MLFDFVVALLCRVLCALFGLLPCVAARCCCMHCYALIMVCLCGVFLCFVVVSLLLWPSSLFAFVL